MTSVTELRRGREIYWQTQSCTVKTWAWALTIIYDFVWLSYQEGKWLLSFWVLPKFRESPLLSPSIVHFKHFEMVVHCHLVYNHDVLRVSPRLEPSLFDDGWSPTACTGAACFTVTPQLSNPLKATQGRRNRPKRVSWHHPT